MAERVSVKATIVNRLGLHARPAMCFVDAASAFQSTVTVARSGGGDGQSVDGKSIMQMMMLAATKGTELTITCEGSDAQKACETLQRLVASGFEEE